MSYEIRLLPLQDTSAALIGGYPAPAAQRPSPLRCNAPHTPD